MNPIKEYSTKLIYFFTFVLACIFMLTNAFTIPIWYDEAITLLQLAGHGSYEWPLGLRTVQEQQQVYASASDWAILVQHIYHHDVHPPLYYLFSLLSVKLLGLNLIYIRLISCISILISGAIIIKCFQKEKLIIPICVVFLFFGSPAIQWASINARDYALTILFVTLAFYSSLICVDSLKNHQVKKSEIHLCLLALFSGLAFSSHYFSILVTGPLFFISLIYVGKVSYKKGIAPLTIICIFIAINFPFLLDQMGARPNQMTGFSGIYKELVYLSRTMLTIFYEHHENYLLGSVQILTTALMFIPYLIFNIKHYKKPEFKTFILLHFCILSFVFLLIALFFITDKTLKGTSTIRYMSFLIPVLAITIGKNITQSFKMNKWLGYSFVCLIFINIMYTWHDNKLEIAPWKDHALMDFSLKQIELQGESHSCVFIPNGFGRGNPSKWVYTLPANVRIQILKKNEDLPSLSKTALTCSLIIVQDDETSEQTDKIHQFINLLKQNNRYAEINNPYINKNLSTWHLKKEG